MHDGVVTGIIKTEEKKGDAECRKRRERKERGVEAETGEEGEEKEERVRRRQAKSLFTRTENKYVRTTLSSTVGSFVYVLFF